MTTTTETWRPVGLQVACQAALSPVPSGGACQVSGDPLKVPSEGPTECKSFRVTCKHAYCVSAWGGMHGCDPPPPTPSPLDRPQSSADTLVSVLLCDLTVLRMPSHPASRLSSKTICRVSSSNLWMKVVFPHADQSS